jgi:cytochrome b561
MKYSLPMRFLHWAMAAIIAGMVAVGWTMTSLDDAVPAKFDHLYPWHKSFGMLVLILVFLRLAMRAWSSVPQLPPTLARWERTAASAAKVTLYALMTIVPCMGYAMSSSYTQSDGVFFFGIMLPELLPKNDARFETFQLLHRVLAYTLLTLTVVHAVGALKHRFIDRDKRNDVLSRML